MDAERERRFWAKVRKTPDCWEWTAAKTQGYGTFCLNQTPQGRTGRAHRIAYELLVGPIPPDKQIDHLCRNRACVNPAHLELVTSRTNTLRGEGRTAHNARKTHCPRGHAYTPENTLVSKGGERFCRECRRLDCERRRRRMGVPALNPTTRQRRSVRAVRAAEKRAKEAR